MCTGLEIASLIAGPALSAVGGIIQQNEAQANAERQAEARNEKLRLTMAKNDDLAKQSRELFDARKKQIAPDQTKADEAKAKADRQAELANAVDTAPAPTAGNASISGSAPTVVKSELAKRVSSALDQAREDAKNQGTLSGYGDVWLNQGLADTAVGRDLGKNANFASGNLAILPYEQDIAEQRAYKPVSPIGGILQGLGSALGTYGGGGLPTKTFTTDPWAGMRTVGSYI